MTGHFTASRIGRLAGAAVLACLALLAWTGADAAAEEAATLEQRVKAAFLYQFAGYVEWPASAFAQADTPVTFAVMGAEAVAAELRQLAAGRTVAGRKVEVRQVRPGEPLAGVH